MADRPDVELLDVREAARAAARSTETIRRWIWAGRLAATKQGNRLFVQRGDLERLLGVGAEPASSDLQAWVDGVRTRSGPVGRRRATAADLVLDDRSARAGQHG